jgi:hypothetical protein
MSKDKEQMSANRWVYNEMSFLSRGWPRSSLMTVDSSLRFRIHSQKFSAGFQERLENGIRIVEIVVNDIHQEKCIHDLCDELA